ncbi:MAG: HEAT repeat domain-containing protein [Alphaproteobacteria bacterium]|nr:HEAT repeat domain-containing protein [Alphaproteobacteria bacterium]
MSARNWLIALMFAAGAPAFAGPAEDLQALSAMEAGYAEALERAVADAALNTDTLSTLAESDDWRVRHEAVYILAARTNPEAVALVEGLRPVTSRAGLPHFQHPELAGLAARAALTERLLRGGESDDVRAALATAVARDLDVDPVVLTGLYRAEGSPAVREALVWGWRKHPDGAAAAKGLALALSDEDAAVRAQAAAAAGYRDNLAELVPALTRALSDADGQVRAMAARSLGWSRDPATFDALAPLLSDSDAEARLQALHALERVDAKRAAGLDLGALAADPDPRVARAAQQLNR